MDSGAPNATMERSAEKPQASPKLNFLLTGKSYTDTLHANRLEEVRCTKDMCHGSIMPEHAPTSPRSKADLLVHAEDFIDQFYHSLGKRYDAVAHKQRWDEVQASITNTGIYDLTSAELTFGAKTAWRNSGRCIGRIQWSKFQVFDARNVRTPQAMFDAICAHLKYATNKGNLRSTMTVFAPRTDGLHDFRVWNIQLIRYAGYQQDDGSVIGDPAGVEFTNVCLKMGWKGKGGRFDVLPLVLQANGGDPELFEIPPELVLEVEFSHPTYPWFEELGLRWYAVPAVSCMMLDCGGIHFTAVPFNGWYMDTEVAARDLCDANRYNVTETVAEKMGLNTTTNYSLWKDKAVIETTLAVLYSFQKARVTMVDHHTASESFMKHFANEHKLRGGCPGDWVWVVPPVGGSSCPVFHQEMLNYKLKPSYENMSNPWTTHVWKEQKTSPTKGSPRKKIAFKSLVKAVKLTVQLMNRAMANRIKCTVLYASETGKSESYATSLSKMFGAAFNTRVLPMDEYSLVELEHETLVLVVASTFGNGDPPDNGQNFAEYMHEILQNSTTHRRESLVRYLNGKVPENETETHGDPLAMGTGCLANLKYSVFALGSTAYPNFCAFGRFVDNILGQLQGERLYPIGEGDELCGQQKSFNAWSKAVFKAACDDFCVEGGDDIQLSGKLSDADQEWAPGKYRLTPVDDESEGQICQNLSRLHNKNVHQASVLSRTQLQSSESDRQTINVRLQMSESGGSTGSYKPGDHVAIYPANQEEIVSAILSNVVGQYPDDKVLRIEKKTVKMGIFGEQTTWLPLSRFPSAFTLRTAFSRYLDVTTPPTQDLLSLLAKYAGPTDKDKIDTLVQDHNAYDEWKFDKFPNFAEVLEEFSSIKLSPTLALSQLPMLKPRYYSISSSPDMFPGEIHTTVSVVNFESHAGTVHRGVCSNWLNSTREGDTVPYALRSAVRFHLPANPACPVLMVGPGTGIAPLRSFWQQRETDKARQPSVKYGDMTLYFGCRNSDMDDLYRHEKQEALNNEVLKQNNTALSRQPGTPKAYVQDLMWKNRTDVHGHLMNELAHVYVCGDVRMSHDVTQTLEAILQKEGSMTAEKASDYILTMREHNRFHEDIFGVTLSTSEVQRKARDEACNKSTKD